MGELTILATIGYPAAAKAKVLNAVDELAHETRLEAGCNLYEIYAKVDGSNALLIHEIWSSSDTFANHLATPHLAAFKALVSDVGGTLSARKLNADR